MSAMQRSKGKRGELELAACLTLLTGVKWWRTAQRCGTHQGDVECLGAGVHVECKRMRAGLRRLGIALERNGATMALGSELIACPLEELFTSLASPFTGTATACTIPARLKYAMRQAERDRSPRATPLVCAREDHGIWYACWLSRDTNALRHALFEAMARA